MVNAGAAVIELLESGAAHIRVGVSVEAAEALETDLNALNTLYDLGVEYVFIGANGDFSGPGLRLDFLAQSDAVKILYNQNGTAVLQILPTDAS